MYFRHLSGLILVPAPHYLRHHQIVSLLPSPGSLHRSGGSWKRQTGEEELLLWVDVDMIPWKPRKKQMENDYAFQLKSGCTLPPRGHPGQESQDCAQNSTGRGETKSRTHTASPSPEFLKLWHSNLVERILLTMLISRPQPRTDLWVLGAIICRVNEPAR